MKATMTVLMAVVFALTVGVVYANSGVTATAAEHTVYNGITYFDLGPAPDCASISGSGAGGVTSSSEPMLTNGVTYVEFENPGSRPTGFCAGSISEKSPGAGMNNGITVFE